MRCSVSRSAIRDTAGRLRLSGHVDVSGVNDAVRHASSPACSVALRYLRALAGQEWAAVTGCLADDVVRHGPFGDDFAGVSDYMSFLQRTIPALPGYRMDVDRVTDLGDQRSMVELRETIELEAVRWSPMSAWSSESAPMGS